MIATKAPAFQWYPRDILASARVQEMSLAEEGAYRRLLDFCWLNGSIPADPVRAARVIGKGATVKMARAVLTMFEQNPHDPSTLIHERLERERVRQELNREKKRQAAMSRWRDDEESEEDASECNADEDARALHSGVHVECSASSSSLATSSTKEKKRSRRTAKPPALVDDRATHPVIQAFRETIGRYPNKALWDRLISEFSDRELELAKLSACRVEWIGRGYNAENVLGWLSWYVSGIPARGRPAQNGSHSTSKSSKSSSTVGASASPQSACGKPARFSYTWPDCEPAYCCEECLETVKLSAAALNLTVHTGIVEGEPSLCP